MGYPRVRELREARGLSQRELAQLLNVKQTTYSKYELGRVGMPVEAFARLADFYHTSVDFLLGRTDSPDPPAPPRHADRPLR